MTCEEYKPEYGEHDKGPWTVSDNGKILYSEDFTHDVVLKIHGDFYGDEQRKRYADNIAAKLNQDPPYQP